MRIYQLNVWMKEAGYEADTVVEEGLGGCSDPLIYNVCLS